MSEPLITFYKIFEKVPAIIPADPSAYGSMPTDAFRYCEAMRTASSFGWYVYPPRTLTLTVSEDIVYAYLDGEWVLVKSEYLNDGFKKEWENLAPGTLKRHFPAFLRPVPLPGTLQIFTGHFVETAPGWSVLVRAPANVPRGPFQVYEGIVETDEFKPCPIFVNLRITETGREIRLPFNVPLAQIQLLPRQLYKQDQKRVAYIEQAESVAAMFPWDRFTDTVHSEPHPRGRYAVARRKRDQRDKEELSRAAHTTDFVSA
ncbi:DUF6065 family protein [Roseibium sp.]|uniref:DUF6065 family protein n=1 Tax=Roseibium sp. TaxID=1936156 RepID=UPI003BACFCE5